MSAMTKRRRRPCIGRAAAHMGVIAVLGILVYSNTFDVPFMFDDVFLIENPALKDMGHFADATKDPLSGGYLSAARNRPVSYFSFAINYRLHGMDVAGYHAFNLAVHIISALLVYWLVVVTSRTDFFRGQPWKNPRHVALAASLLFVTHPVQTEAVTYIFQRNTSLMALLYLLSLVLYAKSRLSRSLIEKCLLYAASICSALLAMKTKESAFTLPIVIGIYEFMFLEGRLRRRALLLLPFAISLLVIPLSLMGAGGRGGGLIEGVFSASRGYGGYSRAEYLLAQARVVATYLRLAFLPVNQNIDYDYPLEDTPLATHMAASATLLAALSALAVYLVRLSRTGHRGLRMTAFGIFWFFVALSVESSVIPLPILIAEYRMYLPFAGLAVAISSAVVMLRDRLEQPGSRTAVVGIMALIVIAFSCMTYSRNEMWQSEERLWLDAAAKSPGKARPRYNLAGSYFKNRRYAAAAREYEAALEIAPMSAEGHYNLGVAYGKLGRYHGEEAEYRAAIRLKPVFAEAHNNLGFLYEQRGHYEEAMEEYQAAAGLKPESAAYRANLVRAVEIMREKEGRPDRER